MKRRDHQVYYKPGSGSLRKSNSCIEETESDSNLVINSKQSVSKNPVHVDSKFRSEGNSPRNNRYIMDSTVEKLGDLSLKDAPRKIKKPDQEIYVPRVVAQNKKPDLEVGSKLSVQRKYDNSHEVEIIGDNDRNSHVFSNGNDRKLEPQNDRFAGSKRYSSRRRGGDNNESRDDWGDKSNQTRQMRQVSEPRGMNNYNRDSNNWQRMRDTKSVEPSGPSNSGPGSNYGDKPYTNKPPTGRRHSTTGIDRINELPPRFRRKMLEEAKLKNMNLQEEIYDGSTMIFQGSNNQQQMVYQGVDRYPSNTSYATLPNANLQQTQNVGYSTLPGRSRGRGRLNYDYNTIGRQQHDVRSPCNSRPPTPTSFGSSRDDSSGRSHTPSHNRKNDHEWSNDEKTNSRRNYDDYDNRRMKNDDTLSRRNKDNYNRNYNDDYDNRHSEDRFQQNRRNDDTLTRRNRDNFNQRFRDDIRGHTKRDDGYRRQDDYKRHDTFSRQDDYRKYDDDRKRDEFRRQDDNRRRNDNRRPADLRSKIDNTKQEKERSYTGEYPNNADRGCKNQYNDSVRHMESRTLYPPEQVITVPQQLEMLSNTGTQPSSASPGNISKETADTTLSIPVVYDWSEEVEMNARLEAEALSDSMTRSSSVASLVESNSTSVPSQSNRTFNQSKKSKRSRSGTRDRSREKINDQSLQNYNFDNFKVPDQPRSRRPSDRRDSSFDRNSRSSRTHSRECSFDRVRRTSASEHGNWREEMKSREEKGRGWEITRSRNNSDNNEQVTSRQNSEEAQVSRQKPDDFSNIDVKKAGVIFIQRPKSQDNGTSPPSLDHPRYAEARQQSASGKKSLYDPNNPDKPIIVKSTNSRVAPGIPENKEITPPPAVYDQYGNLCPIWYREDSDEYRLSHYPNMIQDVKRADHEIKYAIHTGLFLKEWAALEQYRQFLKESLQYFLCKDLKFSQTGNIEQHFWNLLYYNIIELIRKAIQEDEVNKEHYKKFVLFLVDEGTQYFEGLLKMLEETYQFESNKFLGTNNSAPQKGLRYIGLALISVQKIFIFLGDLARYKEQINETTNYGKCRQWYIKAQEINPKNGRPYKKLAVLAVWARRKLDAVYFYMRSLMASNPMSTAKERLTSLFHENSKKYDQGEKKRREEKLERRRQHMKEKESEQSNLPTSVRRETWIRPDGGKRVHRTTQAVQEEDSEEEDLTVLSSVEVNKRFVISYLHVHGKLITKIGMESFQEAAMQMLKEFRALLQHSPLPLPSNRLLQLLALNMFAIESTQLKDQKLSGYRSEYQERALVVSLQMFNLILERCVSILEEHLASKPEELNAVSMDAHILLPPIKIWCDWMLCHSSVWNPPPSTQEFKIGTPGDAWTRLATLINLLEQLDQSAASVFVNEQLEGYELIKLPEDNVLCGFTPLMVNVDEPSYIPSTFDVESAQFVLRLKKLLFFGTEFLCGLEPPVLKLEIDNDFREYVSVVSSSNSRDSPQSVTEMRINNEVLTECFSEDEQEMKCDSLSEDMSSEVRDLLNRKEELEKRHKSHELHMERVKKILSQSIISVHIDILPKYLVPDTNCFIDHLEGICSIIKTPSSPYTIMVPIVVLGELEGLSRGRKTPIPGNRSLQDPDHVKKVGEAAKDALVFLKKRHPNLKCVTTKGAIVNSTTFTTEDDVSSSVAKNDDKILTTCLKLSKLHEKDQTSEDGEPRQLFREVVLLTDDRNLRVKALSNDVPVRELPDFMKWAGML